MSWIEQLLNAENSEIMKQQFDGMLALWSLYDEADWIMEVNVEGKILSFAIRRQPVTTAKCKYEVDGGSCCNVGVGMDASKSV